MEQNYDDTFLARWIAGELTEAELSEFRKSTEYSEYEKIIEGAGRLEAPSFDRQGMLDSIRSKRDSGSASTVRRLIPAWGYAAAAAVAVLLLGYFFLFNTTSFDSAPGEIVSVALPAGSQVTLNAEASLSYKERSWNRERNLSLEGEALFDVTKGNTFRVSTSQGTVTVVGTQFTVNSRDNYFDVICYEGSVRVQSSLGEALLKAGEAIRVQNGESYTYEVDAEQPEWLRDASSFTNAPILHVVNELERQFGITISNKESLGDGHFTGRFTHSNLELALKTVFDAMEITYTFDGNNNVSIQK